MKSIKINEETYNTLLEIKQVDKYKSVSAVIDDLITLVPLVNNSIKEAPAWDWTVGFVDNHTPDETLKVSWNDLRKYDVGYSWEIHGSWDSYEAKIIFKDDKGVLLRFGEQRYDDSEMIYHTEYYHFIEETK